MFGTRRLAKRSIIGTRVCAPWTDGRFYPGIIQSTQTWPNGEQAYTVYFDDGFARTFMDKDLVGPGFQNTSYLTLKFGQKVFLTHNSREFTGVVDKHDVDNDEITITITGLGLEEGASSQVVKKLDDVRLIESRKSARLQDCDTDYSRLADMHRSSQDPNKKRTVSHVIDVPTPIPKQSRRRKSPSPDPDDEEMVCDDVTSERAVMDDRTAAMVLTSLSCSPASPCGPPPEKAFGSPFTGSSVGSSGVWSSTPSPSQNLLSNSAPITPYPRLFSTTVDEGVEMDDSSTEYFSEEMSATKKRKSATRTVYKCTWPGCGKLYNKDEDVESHIRHDHLGPRETGDQESDTSDHEEEFYYTEMEVTVDTVTQSFADMHTSSPPEKSKFLEVRPPTDHDYQKKDPKSAPQAIPHMKSPPTDHPRGATYPASPNSPLSAMARTFSWQSPGGARITKATSHQGAARSNFISSSPKSSPLHKKSRSEVKKCRKVYGMENREMWCTQCKWKKACTRFMD